MKRLPIGAIAMMLLLCLLAWPTDARSHSSGGDNSSHSHESSSHSTGGSHGTSHTTHGGSHAYHARGVSAHSHSSQSRQSRSGAHHASHVARTHTTPTSNSPLSRGAIGVARNSHGKIARSAKAKDDFRHAHPCPSTGRSSGACPGYVIDHVQALKHVGADAPSNMQWQTTAAAKAKHKIE